MSEEDVARIESLGAIAVSPDGSRIAYTSVRYPDVIEGEENGAARQKLRLAWAAMQARQWLPDEVSPGDIRFSPDGRTISFLWGKEGEKRAVWEVPVDGGAYRKLAAIENGSVLAHRWSPTSGEIYLLVSPPEDKPREKQRKAGFDAEVYEEEFRPNRMFVARSGEEIDPSPREIALPGHVSGFELSPDGQSLVVMSAPSPLVDDSYTCKRIHILDARDGKLRRVVATPGKLGDVEISPDSRQIAMIAGVDVNDPAETTLHLVDMATGAYRALNAGMAEAAMDAEWLADGRLAVVVHKGAQSALRLYDRDGTMAEEIDPGALILTQVESGAGKLAVEANSPEHPGELFVLNEGRFERWSNHNPWLAQIDLAPQRTVKFAARDGQEIEGILIEPLDPRARSKAPTIMMIHGGPESHYSNGWLTAYSMPGQVGAGRGYAVFHPNYRGSTAYGTSFSRQHQGDYAGKEFDDILDGKRYLVSIGLTDPARTGITGGSYGGYASGWGATAHSDEYAAAVMFVGISDQISKFGTTDIPWEMRNVHALRWPWEDWQAMLEASPIYHTDKAKTPVLILHGKEDTRVSPTQSMELYRYIKVRQGEKTPVRLVFYPGEGHGNRKAASRLDYNLRMMRWFDHYLKTGNRTAPLPPPRVTIPLKGKDEASEENGAG